ncbi:threalose-6-phosphate phosphatase [Chytriomyces hyalinus]|nr:threalose-6-phosphate phosphatase [Chytriomyces hyalinus]
MDSAHRAFSWTKVITEGIALLLNFTLIVSNIRFIRKLPHAWTLAATHLVRNSLEYDKRVCQIHGAMVVGGALVSMSLCAGLTLLRYRVIVKAQKITNIFLATYISTSVVVATTVVGFPFLLGSQDESYFMQPSGDNCTPRWHGRHPQTVVLTSLCAIILATPLVGIAYAYYRIYQKVSTTFETFKNTGVVAYERDLNTSSTPGTMNASIPSDSGQQTKSAIFQNGRRKKSEEEEKQINLLIQSIAIVGLFIVGWGPYFLFGVTELLTGVQQATEFEFAADFVSQLNYVANPIVILVFDKEIRSNKLFPNMASKLITATHHLPVELHLEGDRHVLHPRKGHSALYSGIKSLKTTENVVHVGCLGSLVTENGLEPIPNTDEMLALFSTTANAFQPVFVDHDTAASHYEGYCKTDLWPLFHYVLWDSAVDGTAEKNHWNDYVAVNQAFADAIMEIYSAGDTIWIHDYHLLLLPSMLRNTLPNATIGLFLHTPFPSSEIFRCLPKRQEILQGMLGANMIGFQTYSYARHFISSCTRVLGLESSPKGVDYKGFQVAIEIFPIGIDVDRVESRRKSQIVKDKIASIMELYAGKKIIIGRDKVDHIKGVQHKLLAYEKFLMLYPEWHNKVVLSQVTTPPQRESPKLESKVGELVSRINGNFGSLEFVPVHHYHHHLDVDDYVSLLSVANVGLMTSVRDGMNTTSHEYVICQQENRGALILSEFAGTAGSLGGAMLVNPWDYSGVAHAINDALTLSLEEKSNRHEQLYNYVILRTASFWARSFVKELRNWARIPDQMNPTPYLDFDTVKSRFTSAQKRLFLFDYDGTLTPIVKTPSAAHPPPDMLKALEVLCDDPRNYVFIISGRDQGALDKWLGHMSGLGLSAEHGCFIKYPGESHWHNLTEQIDLSWKNEVTEIFSYYTERTQGSFIEHKKSSITWHYRLADPDYGIFQAKECQNHLENAILSKLPVEVLIGKKNLEVRPISINKGEIVKSLLNSQPETDFVLCAGDDKTDEDMFKALARSNMPEDDCFTVTIGSATKKTKASWHVVKPEELIDLLGVLAEAP